MPLAAGDKLGPYEILGPIGAGGMGEVYLARDPRLGRDVAIKVSAAQFTERFDREARAVAALNHVNICHIYDVGPNFLVMELVEGPTLAERIASDAIPLEESLKIATQIADALDAAHEKGITHRDLKPANVKVKADGTVKVLDFGLAKIDVPAVAQSENSPTLSMAATQAGMILGTAAYMAPEQARGRPVDRRADIWAFGVVLYEMLTGKRLFQGEDLTETLASVVKEQPDLSAVPARVRRLLQSCLEKDPKKRLQAIGDMRLLLEEQPAPPVSQSGKASRLGWVAAAIVTLALAALAFLHFRETPPETPVLRTTILPPDNTTLDFGNGLGLPALSPDGKRIVFGARTSDGKHPLWVRRLDGLTAQPLAGTDGATFPFWSPDSRYIAFFADGRLKKIDASGGPAIALASAAGARGGSWSTEGVIIFAPGGGGAGLERVSFAGGPTTSLPAALGRLPWFLPDGRHFLYQNVTAGNGVAPEILVGSLDGGPSKKVGEAGSNALYAQGHLLYLRDGTLMAQPFDAKSLSTTGEEIPLAEQVQSVLNSGTVGSFSVSATGLVAYRAGDAARGRVLTWFDRSGKPGTTVGEPAVFGTFESSPDRKSLAATIGGGGNLDIWTYDVSRGIPTRLTTDAARDEDPVWSPDGRSIAFASDRKGHFDLYRRSANGAGADELLYADDLDKYPTSWSADGKFLLFYTAGTNSKTKADIWALPLTPEKPGGPLKPFVVVQTPFNEGYAQFSPDGKWMVYGSQESGRDEIYVTQFPPPLSGPGGKRQISTAGGVRSRWRQDAKEIFYIAADRRMTAAEVAIKGGAVEVGQVRALFGPVTANFYDVSADGQRFLIPDSPDTNPEPLTLIQNWAAGLKK